MTQTLYTKSEMLVTLRCYLCKIDFAVPTSFNEERQDDHGTFYCPVGHGQHFLGETEADRLKEELDRANRRLGWANDSKDRLQKQRDTEARRAAAYKGQTTKLKKRVAAGVCPCCARSFVQLKRHMDNQHPGFDPSAPADA